MKIKKIIAVVLVAVFASFSFGDNSEAKNFRTRRTFVVSGNETNPDASVAYAGSDQTYFYRRATFPKLKMADPFALRIFHQDDGIASGFGEPNWSTMDHNFITNGNIWNEYGDSVVYEGTSTFYPYVSGNFRAFSYYGGTKKKKRKRSAYKLYEFTPTGTEGNADAVAQDEAETVHYFYRKIPIADLKMDNLVDYRLYSRNPSQVGFTTESWDTHTDGFFITDGYLYVNYGWKTADPDAEFVPNPSRNYRLFTYSDGKRSRNTLKKQYVKKYAFSIPSDPAVADKVATYTDPDGYVSKDYYKKIAISGLKIADIPNLQVMRKNNFYSGFSDESWSQRGYTITNRYLWIYYGYQTIDPDGATDGFQDYGSGDYQIFQYR